MKILHLGKYYYPYRGGMESVVRDICEGVAKNGHEVTVLCSNDAPVDSCETIKNVKISRMKRLGILFGQCLNFGIFSRLKSETSGVDIVHVHSPNPLIEFATLFLPKEIPVVVTYHSDVVRQKMLMPFYAPILKKFLKRANKILVPTQNHISCSQVLGEFENKCKIIPFGIRPESMERPSEEHIERVKNEHGPYGLFVGRLVGYKGVDVLVDAMARVEGKVVVVGQGPLENKLKEQVKNLGIEHRVTILGGVEDANTFKALYHGCEFLVLPSVTPNENFGVVQLEAMACHKAVITTNLKSGVPCVGQKNVTSLLVEPSDVDQLSKAMTMLFNNPELSRKLGREGHKRFIDKYTYDQMVYSHIEEYETTIGIQTAINKHLEKKAA